MSGLEKNKIFKMTFEDLKHHLNILIISNGTRTELWSRENWDFKLKEIKKLIEVCIRNRNKKIKNYLINRYNPPGFVSAMDIIIDIEKKIRRIQ